MHFLHDLHDFIHFMEPTHFLSGLESCKLFSSSFYCSLLLNFCITHLQACSSSSIIFSPIRIVHSMYHGFLQKMHNEALYFSITLIIISRITFVFSTAAALTWCFRRAICYEPEISFLSNDCQLSMRHCMHKDLSLFFTNHVKVPVVSDP